MGLDSESSCEETDVIVIETSEEDCLEPTTDDNESPIKQDDKSHICEYEGCNKKFSRPSKLQAHLCYHTGERAYKCERKGCNKSYSRAQHLRRHIATAHDKDSKERKLLRCPYPNCMRELSNQQNLKKHHYRKHERIHPYTCQYCDKGFPKHQQLKQHLFHHTGIPPFRCSECNIGFTKIGDLNRHNRGHKTYTCSFAGCGVVLKAWTHMRTHIKLKHPSEFPCDHCGRTFRTKCRLKIHATIHKDPHERETFSCGYPNCPRFYFKKSNLTQHIKSSHQGIKFECTYKDCGRKLCSKKKLQDHLKLHIRNRPAPRRRKKPRKKRSDSGKIKRSMAVKLSGIKIPYEFEKMLLNSGSDISEHSNTIQSSPSHTVVAPEQEKSAISQEDIQNEVNKSSDVGETVVLGKEQALSCTRDSEKSPMKEIQPKIRECRVILRNIDTVRLSNRTEILITIPYEKNKSNLNSEQQNGYHKVDCDDSHFNYSDLLNLNESDMIISLDSDENSTKSLTSHDTIISLDSNENSTKSLTSCNDISLNSDENVPKSLTVDNNMIISLESDENVTKSLTADNKIISLDSVENITKSLATDNNMIIPLNSDENATKPLTTDNSMIISLDSVENITKSLTTDNDTKPLTTDNDTKPLTTDNSMIISLDSVENITKSLTTDNDTKPLTTDNDTIIPLNSDENARESLTTDDNMIISLNSNENSNMSLISKEDVNISLKSNDNLNICLNLEETNNISLFDLNVKPLEKSDSLSSKSVLNVPLEDEMCCAVMCINSDRGTLLQEVDAASADNRKSRCLAENDKHLQSASERENIEKNFTKKSGDVTETKVLNPPSEDNLQTFASSNVPKSNKRKVVSNRKIIAHYKKLKTAAMTAKPSTSPLNNLHQNKHKVFNRICTSKEETQIALDTIYKEDKYIEDCLRVIDSEDLRLVEERSDVLDDMQLHNRESKCSEIQNVINNRQISVTEVDKNVGSLGTSPSLKHLLLRRKQKSLDQIVHSLHSVLENKLGGNDPSVPSTVKLDSIVNNEEIVTSKYSKSSRESSNTSSLFPGLGEFCIGDVRSSDCSVTGSNDNLRDLLALSQKALLEERTGDNVKTPADRQLGYAKEGDTSNVYGVTIERWLQLMQKTMECIFPSLKQGLD